MWFSKGSMRLMFFSGASIILIGLGIVLLGQNVAGAAIMCIGLFPAVIGFMGLRVNLLVDLKSPHKRKENPGEDPGKE